MVNVFASSTCPVRSARALDNKRVGRMCYEAYEVLSGAIQRVPKLAKFQPDVFKTKRTHGCMIWAAEDSNHFLWLLKHADSLNTEYMLRYNKTEPYKTHGEMYHTMVKAWRAMGPSKLYEDQDILNINFGGWFNHNAFRHEAVRYNEGVPSLPEHVSMQGRIQLSLLHKWLYLDKRVTVWPEDRVPIWVYNPEYRDWLEDVFGPPTKYCDQLMLDAPEYDLSLKTVPRSTSMLDLASSISDKCTQQTRLAVSDNGNTKSVALHADKDRRRLLLCRQWDERPPLVVVLCNPSTADENKNDPTIQRIESRARKAKAGGYIILNLMSWKETKSGKLRDVVDRIGPDNALVFDEVLSQYVRRWRKRPRVLLAFGDIGKKHCDFNVIDDVVKACLNRGHVLCLGTTKSGMPKHPLYIANDEKFRRFQWRH